MTQPGSPLAAAPPGALAGAAAPPRPLREVCPAFTPARLRRHLGLDALGRLLGVTAVAAAVVLAAPAGEGEPTEALFAGVLIAAVWLMLGLTSARAWRSLPAITAMLEHDPDGADAALAAALRRWPLQRSIRLTLYHRLAGLRYRQERFAEAAEVCRTLLARKAAALKPFRGGMLLILVEASLRGGELERAGEGLDELERTRLGALEALHRTAVRTRFEVALGRHADALAGLEEKVRAAELMPGAHCGAVHAWLSVSASALGQHELARWLRQRAELLCTPEQMGKALAGVGRGFPSTPQGIGPRAV